MRLVIIDDEKIIREGLKNYIRKSDMGFDEIYTYESGVQALEQARNVSPDVVIADVLMPEMDGLTTVEQIFQLLPRVQVIVISGCCDFKYVRQSLNYPVIDYIPKPVDLSHLKAALNRALRQIGEMRQAEDRALNSERILSMLGYLQEQFLRSVLLGGYSDAEQIHQGLDRLDLKSLHTGRYAVAVLTPRREWNDSDALKDISSLMGFWVERFREQRVIAMDEKHLCVLFHMSSADEYSACVKRLEDVLRESLSRGSILLSAGLSMPATDIAAMNAAYRQAYDAMQTASIENCAVMMASDAQIADNPQSYFIGEDLERALRAAVVSSDEERLGRLLARCSDSLIRSQDVNALWHARLEIVRIYVNLLHALDDQSQTGILSELGLVQNLRDAEELVSWFGKLLLRLMNNGKGKRASRAERISTWMRREIDEHYGSILSLQDFSDESGLSTNYLSQIFIQNTGVSFIRYLADRRMNRAVQLLKDTRMSIGQIAAAIGYEDSNYFTRLFRKRFDLSPSEFREKDV